MFDWQFFQDEKLIEEYNDIELLNDILYANDDLYFDYNSKVLYKNNDDIKIKIDFLNNKLYIILNDNILESLLHYSDIKDDDNIISYHYQISEGEPRYKIIITRKE